MTLKKLIIVANTIEKKLNKFAAVAGTTINDSLNYGLQGIAKVTIEDMKIEENALKIIQTPSSKKIEGYFKTSEDRPLKVIAKKENGKWKMIRGGVVIDVAFNDEQLNTKLKTLVGKLNSVLSNKFLELINKVSAQDNWDASIDEVSFETNVAPQSLIDLSV